MITRVLVVEDDDRFANLLTEYLGQQQCSAQRARTLVEARAAVRDATFDVVLLDAMLPDGSGHELIAELRSLAGRPSILFLTANGIVSAVVEAMRAGADDYLVKGLKPAEIVARIHQHRAARLERPRPDSQTEFNAAIVGTGQAMTTVRRLASLAARTATTVLISGETGTGKSYLARMIHSHSHSPRRDRPFVTVDCAALSESLAESVLFGHERGAFTGALQRHIGAIESAANGTLFFDEIADLTPSAQGKLLRVLEERVVLRVGGTGEIPVHARIVAATRRDLATLVAEGRFREDLYFRLTVLEISLPPLRERSHDVPLLFERFLRTHIDADLPVSIINRLMPMILSHPFPGNVREVRNLAERLALLLRDGEHGIDAAALGLGRAPVLVRRREQAANEQTDIGDALVSCGGRIGEAAKNLGMSRHALRRRLKRLQHDPPRLVR